MKNKRELIQEAEALDIDTSDMTKDQLEEAIVSRTGPRESFEETPEPEPEQEAPVKKKKKKTGGTYPIKHPHGVLQPGRTGLSTGG